MTAVSYQLLVFKILILSLSTNVSSFISLLNRNAPSFFNFIHTEPARDVEFHLPSRTEDLSLTTKYTINMFS